ncbi:Avr9/Cf-9 rapidly elicited protein [Medicago truncatula]|uniref:Avr9/Cf-9 rapidly elicited protein n=1 Tax=Medicago truncatula TaxID=3880 RepID=G7L7H2_MEDTR|nr:Avr9/Cf-9 rapidly elicited protein [Medicago truncatula]
MEIEARQGVVAKKLWNMVRVLLFIIRKGIAKSKTMVHLNLILKRGKLAGKALINTLMLNHQLYHSSFTCRSDNNSFISPCEYEFSCRNTPANPLRHSSRRFSKSRRQRHNDFSIMNNNIAVQKVFIEMMLNNEKVEAVANSPLAPFTLEDEGNCHQVDIAAEEFINNFYKELNRQNRTIAS